ncbi:MAG: hypothetical protein WC756_19115 [Taibaiella sp.]|jgi:hypothetical protein
MFKGARLLLTMALYVIAFISCGEKNRQQSLYVKVERFPNGNIKEGLIKVGNDSIDFKGERFYPSGAIQSQFSMKNGLMHGYTKDYYPNGKVFLEGLYVAGRKKGYFRYYDSTEHLEKVIYFINYRDSSVARPNEIIRFNRQGDTLYEESYFYEFFRKADTLTSISDGYKFKFVSKGRIFPYSYLILCNFDEKYNFLGSNKCIPLLMKGNIIELSRTNNKSGINFLRGYILNTQSPLSSDGKYTGKSVEMYFSIPYYVR